MNNSQKIGWVRFHRKSMDSTVWKNPKIWIVWSWCLLKANHQISKFPFNNTDIILRDGQFISGLYACQKEIPSLTPQNIKTAWKYLKSTNRITIKTTNKFSLFTIINWKEYQNDNQQTNKPLTNKQLTTNKPLTTYKNDKNEEKKESLLDKIFSMGEPTKEILCKYFMDNSRRDIYLIGLYLRWKGISFKDKAQVRPFIKRCLPTTVQLVKYEDKEIEGTWAYMDKIKINGAPMAWTLETTLKYITQEV